MADQPLQLQRTTYRDPNSGEVRPGSPTCGESALDMEQYYQPLERFHASSLHGWGIAVGLRVTATLNSLGVTVRPGIALDNNGLHIFLVNGGQADTSPTTPGTTPLAQVIESGVAVPTTTLTGDQYLIIQFWETFDSQAVSSGIFRYTHTPWLHFVDAAHLVQDGSSIILAKVSFGTDANTGQVLSLAQDMQQRAYGHVERTHEASIHGAGVVAGLDVVVTPSNAGVTVLPGIALDGNGQYLSLASGGQTEIGSGADAPGATPTLAPITDTGTSIPTTGLSGDKYLTIQFWETAICEALAPVTPFHFAHTPWLRLLDVTGFVNDGTRVVLAKVSFGTGANAGLVTNLAVDQRQETSLTVGSIHLQKNVTTLPTITTKTIQAGAIRAYSSGGIDITVPNPTDEVHLERDDGGNFHKVSLGADAIVARRSDGEERVAIDTSNGNITADGNITTGSSLLCRVIIAGPPLVDASPIAIAGIFSGQVIVEGTVIKSASTFKIDHPLDPAHKYLSHSCVESPDMKNIYDGVATLDANGEAVVELPLWFEVLNRDLRYQLTCIGDYAPVYIAEKVKKNHFKIAGGQPGLEVSWQVTGSRQDAWANANRIVVEEEKPLEEQGYYLHPELFGAPEEKRLLARQSSPKRNDS